MKGLWKGAVQVFIALVLVSGGFGLMVPVVRADPDPGSISGRVYIKGTTTGIPNLRVSAVRATDFVTANTTSTNSTGGYKLTGLSSGNYLI